MEFDFSINNLFGDVITKVDRNVLPFKRAPDIFTEHRNQLMKVLDKMGEASSRAQGLHGPITSGRKLEISDHHIYVIKDGAHGDKGCVIGFIKVGHKKLFVYDHNGGQHEMEPVCVLDFYVHESRQRQGHGKRLFQHMLKAEGVKAPHLAIDRPSHKFSAFLQKHYKLKTVIPQVNNFVVFDGFFRDRTDMSVRGTRHGSAGRPPTLPYRRPGHVTGTETYDPVNGEVRPPYYRALNRPPSGRKVSSGATNRINQENSLLRDVNIRPCSRQSAVDDIVTTKAENTSLNRPETLKLNLNGVTAPHPHHMLAGANMYSRHGRRSATPPPRKNSAVQRGQNGVNRQIDLAIPNTNTENTERATTPPLLNREGPSISHIHHQDYMSRDGHLKLPPRTATTTAHLPDLKYLNRPAPVSEMSPTYDQSIRNITANTTWTVFGVIPSGYQHRQYSHRKYQHTKLW